MLITYSGTLIVIVGVPDAMARNIYLIDDDKDFQALTKHKLKKLTNDQIHLFSNATDALEMIQHNDNLEGRDIIYLDINLPDFNADIFLKKIDEIARENPIFNPPEIYIVTGSDLSQQYAKLIYNKNVKDFFRKKDNLNSFLENTVNAKNADFHYSEFRNILIEKIDDIKVKIDRLDSNVESLEKKLFEDYQARLIRVEVKSGLWGALAGLIPFLLWYVNNNNK